MAQSIKSHKKALKPRGGGGGGGGVTTIKSILSHFF